MPAMLSRSAGAGVRRPQDAGEMAQLEPAWKGLDDGPRTFQLDAARSHGVGPDEMPGPHADERAHVCVKHGVDREAGIPHAHVGA